MLPAGQVYGKGNYGSRITLTIILLVSVICFKFLAALQFGRKNVPENLDKFVICC